MIDAEHDDVAARADAAGDAAVATFDVGRRLVTRGDMDAARTEMDAVALTAMAETLRCAGLFGPNREHGTGEVTAALRAAPRHHWLVRRWLRGLCEEGFLHHAGTGAYRGLRAPGARPEGSLGAACTRLGYPEEMARFFGRANERLAALVRDEILVQELLFPDGAFYTAEKAYRDNAVNRYLNAATTEIVSWAAKHLRPATGPLRVLELGAGIGGTTADVLPVLSDTAVDYLFTDLSTFFLDAAKERFREYPWLRYGLLDMNTGLAEQPQRDLVLAANVLHNAHDVARLLREVRNVLAPGGMLVFLESCREHYQLLTSMHFLMSARSGQPPAGHGDGRASADRIFLGRREWHEQLGAAGLRPVVTLPSTDYPLAALGQYLFVARREG